jgi:lysophospholipase L1-like esterase
LVFAVKDGETILLIGDSITDCGRRTQEAPLGNGYVRIFSENVTAAYPERSIRYINKGIGGNRAIDLRNRWKDDVMDQDFQWLTIMIGINDCATYILNKSEEGSPETYADIYGQLLEETTSEHPCDIVLLDPFYISRDDSGNSVRSEFLQLLPDYIKTVHRLSKKYKTRLVKTHQVFQNHLKYREPDFFTPEPVHPYHIGHVIMAHELFKALSR